MNMYENGIQQLHGVFMPEFVIPDGVREKWLLNPRNFSHAAFKDKYQCYYGILLVRVSKNLSSSFIHYYYYYLLITSHVYVSK